MGLKSLRLVDKFLTPQYYIQLSFSGKGVDKSYKVVPSLIKKVFGIASKDWAEPQFKFDITDPNSRGFYAQWVGKVKPALKSTDRWTSGRIEAFIQGSFSTKTGEGSFDLFLVPSLETEFEYSNFLQRFLYDIYAHTFYNEQRRKYVEWMKLKLKELIDELKSVYGGIRVA